MTPLLLLFLLLPQPLFTIERSTNANVVHYDAQIDISGSLDSAQPVIGYWTMLAERGQYEEFNSYEERSLYGLKLFKDPAPGCIGLTLAANRKLPIRVCANHGVARAETDIDGHAAILEHIFIRTKGAAFWKTVDYFELFGTDVQTGVRRYEKVRPK